MLARLIILFTAIPIAELYVLFKLAEKTSALTTIAIVLLTGVVGAYLAKSQGRAILDRIRLELNSGRMPGNELINGLCVLIGGALLLTPGIITDVMGFSLVIPATREVFKQLLRDKFKSMLERGNINIYRK
ncbi:FxsA family protein [Clostridiisalibacter paucivorans]|uniref:FxsA family protein n=1 Tax=Clostridiisalibacter paucivorans TaxID=408753 RepID=UPI00047C361E|nr:FxsA family protein [Clostridiisalibacter paucivorans]